MPQVAQPWMPGAQKIDRGGGTPVQWNGPTVLVLHTTESSGPASYSGTEPHFEVFEGGPTKQFISLNNTAKALYNAPGGVETNRRRGRIIQIEIVWRAHSAPSMPSSLLRKVAKVIAFVKTQFPDLVLAGPPQGFHGDDEGVTLASEHSPFRFGLDETWENYCGICGHQHVPENDHWDCGRIDIERLIAMIHEELGTSPAPSPAPEETELFTPSTVNPTLHLIASHSGLLLTAEPRSNGTVTTRPSDGSKGQRWQVWGHADGSISLVTLDGLALDVRDGKFTADAWLQVYPFDGSNPNQRFTYEEVGASIRIRPAFSRMVLNVAGASRVDGAPVVLWEPSDVKHERFNAAITV